MSITNSTSVVTDGLVFYYDMNNTKKSWKGAPTTNLVPSPAVNGRFTTANSWGTYNVNQYNNNQYFSIGTISSVVGNVVTTTTSHPLRTFDVVSPQTTGGGVSTEYAYLVKKINATQFTLHTWNSNETGSQGYLVNGYHKVHESIGLDQRITINSTDFPTMWWGSTHRPNSHLVKEIVEGAGPTGQSVMRLHIPGIDGAADGMAYGVYVPVTINDVINISFLIRSNYPGKNLNYQTYFGPGNGTSSSNTIVTNEWQLVKLQWVASATYNFYQYFFPEGTIDRPYWIDLADLQVEVNTGSAGSTPFVAGTRSSIESIKDLSGNKTITPVSSSYASDNTFSFNGSSDYIQTNLTGSFSQISFEFWSFFDDPALNMTLRNESVFGDWIGGRIHFGSRWEGSAMHWNVNNIWETTPGTHIRYGWNHYSLVWNNNTNEKKVYINSILSSSNSTNGNITLGNLKIGVATDLNLYYRGTLSKFAVYNRALTALEVQQNFNAIRGRYSI